MKCPQCLSEMRATVDTSSGKAQPVWLCPNMDAVLPRVDDKELEKRRNAPAPTGRSGGAISEAGKIVQRKLLDPGPRTKLIHVPEEAIQNNTVMALTRLGFVVGVTTERRKGNICPNCRQWVISHKGSGVSKANPDLLIRNPQWYVALILGVEMKGSKTPLSPEQKQYHEAGHILVCRSTREVLLGVHAMNLRLLSPAEMMLGPAKKLADELLNRNGVDDVAVPSNPTDANVEAQK